MAEAEWKSGADLEFGWVRQCVVLLEFLVEVQTEHPLARHICARAESHRTRCTGTVTHHANTHGSIVIPASCLICCRSCPRALLRDLSHLSSDHLLPHCPVLHIWIKKPCKFHGGVADTLNLHLPLVMSPRRIELDRNLGTDLQP